MPFRLMANVPTSQDPLITISPSSTASQVEPTHVEPWDPSQGAPPVALVTMPFVYSKFPSIQLGTLSRVLKNQGIGVKSFHFNVLFAQEIGVALYEILCEKRGLIGEWLFSSLLFRDNPKHLEYPKVFQPVFASTAQESGCSIQDLEAIAHKLAPQFLTNLMASYEWDQFKVIGFTSTFDQNVASLTLAKLIKDLYPDVRIVFGGANFDGEMGLEQLRAFPWIDYVVVGEGEVPFPALVQNILAGQEESLPPGIAYRKNGQIHHTPNSKLFSDFHLTGPPDYDDYFALIEDLEKQGSTGLNRILLYEGSRGCWWGEKHHCTFCGLNAQSMKFRAKTSDQVAQEMDYLSSRYDTTRFRMVDNIIDMKYIDNLFGKFAQGHFDLDVFMETKSNLTKRQIKTLAHGGVKCMQPGIESLSAAQLKEMDKGVSPLQNIQCLKWSRYYNIDISWNILLGFPQETDDDYRGQIDLIPSLLHFQPPESTGKLWLERFSPYFMRPEEYGIRMTGPGDAYEYVYDSRKVDLNKIAYDFEFEADWKVTPALYDALVKWVQEWRARYFSDNRPFLFYAKALSYVTVYDGRTNQPTSERYDGPAAFVIEHCNEIPKTLDQIRRGYDEISSNDSPADIEKAVATLLEKRILCEDKGRHFSLALPVNPNL